MTTIYSMKNDDNEEEPQPRQKLSVCVKENNTPYLLDRRADGSLAGNRRTARVGRETDQLIEIGRAHV